MDLNLNSAATNLANGIWRTEKVEKIDNLLVKIVPPEGEAPLGEGLETTENASYQDMIDKITEMREQSENPDAVVLRVTKPGNPPSLAVDSEGKLVAVLRDVVLEVSAPENFGQGGLLGFGESPRVLRYTIEQAEIAMSARFVPQIHVAVAVKIDGQIESVTYGGSGTTVVAVGDTEDDVSNLSLLNRSGALGVLAGKLQGRRSIRLCRPTCCRGSSVTEISDFDPTGWMRVVLQRDSGQPVASPSEVTAEIAPAPPAGPGRGPLNHRLDSNRGTLRAPMPPSGPGVHSGRSGQAEALLIADRPFGKATHAIQPRPRPTPSPGASRSGSRTSRNGAARSPSAREGRGQHRSGHRWRW